MAASVVRHLGFLDFFQNLKKPSKIGSSVPKANKNTIKLSKALKLIKEGGDLEGDAFRHTIPSP